MLHEVEEKEMAEEVIAWDPYILNLRPKTSTPKSFTRNPKL